LPRVVVLSIVAGQISELPSGALWFSQYRHFTDNLKEKPMHSAATTRFNISTVGSTFGSTQLAAIGRCVLTLAVLSALLLVAAQPANAQTESVLYNFANSPDGATPDGQLTSDTAGNFYGTTVSGGLGYGTVFELSPNGVGGYDESVLYAFTGAADGANPTHSSVIFDSLGNLYGSTWAGGANGYGVVYELSPVGASWTEAVLYSFNTNNPGQDGVHPSNGLIWDSSGNLYGTTYEGPAGGSVFELSPDGSGGWTEKVVYSNCVNYAGVTMDAHGNIFGAGCSNVFELSPNGSGGWTSTVIHAFAGGTKDGSDPESTPVVDSAGNVYGTTTAGGAHGQGTVYKLTPILTGKKKGTWTLKLLASFKGGTKDGSDPFGGIVFDASGNIYGTTVSGGKSSVGTVYELVATVGKTTYKEKVLWSFNGTDGSQPYANLILDGGNLYGTTELGGTNSDGVVFELTP
jgi:uncharacterized repeat protein (TIGR03803 family)